MNILYLHGLQSKLSSNKRKILEDYGSVFAPDIQYENKHIQAAEILKDFTDTEFNVVIGSSMGALNAYIISENIGRPALLFNPPLQKYEAVKCESFYTKGLASKNIFIGGRDEVVDPSETLKFLADHIQQSDLHIDIDSNCGHRIPVDIFSNQVSSFFSSICN
ncbi:hypothetical protein C7S20_18280 [Christiangramia fulva]|uniref:Alpha/beta hydrolase n=1 Tax=Christiangramia fulva TaxID=2126553 RepID=A0A2R3Z9T3_9FLAO|nr:YqiA/YcfP family alpha/beta fold hydrolase [Christiangramia fulva]AVR47036.1 hypothetical protein C7S20_18280 [Christiangramia fulva]